MGTAETLMGKSEHGVTLLIQMFDGSIATFLIARLVSNQQIVDTGPKDKQITEELLTLHQTVLCVSDGIHKHHIVIAVLFKTILRVVWMKIIAETLMGKSKHGVTLLIQMYDGSFATFLIVRMLRCDNTTSSAQGCGI